MKILPVVASAVAAVVVFRPFVASGQSPTKMDFARGFELRVDSAGPLQAVVLPADVYAIATAADLSDVRVFNGDGEEVPVAVQRAIDRERMTPPPQPLPLFPIRARSTQSIDNLNLKVEQSPSGTLVQITAPSEGPNTQVRGYILDASAFNDHISRLQLVFSEDTEFLTDVNVATSDDLTRWRQWDQPVTVASLRYDGNVLTRAEIERSARRTKFVRLSWRTGDSMPPLDSVIAVFADREDDAERQWLEVEAEPQRPLSSELRAFDVYEFDKGSLLPIDRIQIGLPQENTLASVQIYSGIMPDAGQRRFTGNVYRLQVGDRTVENAAIPIARTSDRYWRVLVDKRGGGIGSEAPRLSFGWVPDRLLFVPRGSQPFVLAVGNADVAGVSRMQSELLSLRRDQEGTLIRPVRASLGSSFDLGGTSRLTKTRTVKWQKITLWAVLIIGVLLLASFSLRLIRNVDEKTAT